MMQDMANIAVFLDLFWIAGSLKLGKSWCVLPKFLLIAFINISFFFSKFANVRSSSSLRLPKCSGTSPIETEIVKIANKFKKFCNWHF